MNDCFPAVLPLKKMSPWFWGVQHWNPGKDNRRQTEMTAVLAPDVKPYWGILSDLSSDQGLTQLAASGALKV
jgi:hypothetical protein